jgi:hypothetical protein
LVLGGGCLLGSGATHQQQQLTIAPPPHSLPPRWGCFTAPGSYWLLVHHLQMQLRAARGHPKGRRHQMPRHRMCHAGASRRLRVTPTPLWCRRVGR